MLQACEAIVEAHDLGIVHRDLKPANLFLSKRADGSPLVKVLDFGISKVDGGSRSQLTSASVLMGSPRYMSPEQMLSAKDVDARTDVWALGVILYELVTGKPVWHADTMQGLCALIASAPAPSLRASRPTRPRSSTTSSRAASPSRATIASRASPISRWRSSRSRRRARVRRSTVFCGSRARIEASAPARSGACGDGARTDRRALGLRQRRRRGHHERSCSRAVARVGLVLAIAVGALLVAGIAINATLAQRSSAIDPAAAIGPAVGPAPGLRRAASTRRGPRRPVRACIRRVRDGSTVSPRLPAGASPASDDGAGAPSAAASASIARRLLRAPTIPPHAAAPCDRGRPTTTAPVTGPIGAGRRTRRGRRASRPADAAERQSRAHRSEVAARSSEQARRDVVGEEPRRARDAEHVAVAR